MMQHWIGARLVWVPYGWDVVQVDGVVYFRVRKDLGYGKEVSTWHPV